MGLVTDFSQGPVLEVLDVLLQEEPSPDRGRR